MFDEHILYFQASSFDLRQLDQYGNESLKRHVFEESKKPENAKKTEYVVHKTISGGNPAIAPKVFEGKISDLKLQFSEPN